MQFVPKLLIFTCNKDPKTWYDWTKCAHPLQALVRRITNEWQYVKQAQQEWSLPMYDKPFHAYAICRLGGTDFHPARRCMQHVKDFPDGTSLFGFEEDPEIGDNVEPEDPDKFFA